MNEEANEINDKEKDVFFTTKEQNKTSEYQETMNLDIEKNCQYKLTILEINI